MDMPTDALTLRRLQDRLRRESTAEVRFDQGSRGLYATDASLYQIEPIGVVIPRTRADARVAARVAYEEGVPILPRGGATSLSGQTVGPSIVFDYSKYLNRIGVVDLDNLTVKVEPGVVLDRLDAHLAPLGLMFGPDVSTSDRATIGGMIGNNSAGARSLRFGKTVDHVEALEVILDDGTTERFGPLDVGGLEAACAGDSRTARLHRLVRDLAGTHEEAIRSRYPKILRRVSGYNLDEFVPGLAIRPDGWPPEPFRFNLSRMIVGSEGTLATVLEAELKLLKRPAAQGLVVISFDSVPGALDRLRSIVETGPAAVEMLDRTILDLAARNAEMARHLDFAEGRPAAVLAAQFYADSPEELEDRARKLAARFEGLPDVLGVRVRLTDSAKDSFWKVRKAGLSLLMGMVGDAKPVAFVEDTAVAPERLPEFYARFMEIVHKHGTHAACYGHADVGCLHIRPVIDVKTQAGVKKIRMIGQEVAELVSEFGGAMSGEHGDGLARSRWNRKLFGEEIYAAFEAIKAGFDPGDRLNPGKVVAEPDLGADLRLGPGYEVHEPAATAFDFSTQGGFAGAIEMCSGVGACRKTGTGTMCPSYMASLEEADSTRGRANALRLAISGGLPGGLGDPAVLDVLDLCLQCKACKTECPSNVDMAKLKSEVLHQLSRSRPVPLGALLMAQIHRINRFGAISPSLANMALRSSSVKWLMEKFLKVDRRRTLPLYAAQTFRTWFRGHRPADGAGGRGEVILLDDCFTNANAPEAGKAAVAVLEAAGYRVRLSGLECCGRPAISKGLLDGARELAALNVRKLIEPARRGVPILGVEPSCLLTFVDEYRDFRLGTDADEVAAACRLVDSFVADPAVIPDLPLRPRPGRALLHGHCQQKALVGVEGTLAALRRIPEFEVRPLDSGCCGMAGSFGYELGHYDLSVALANRVLLPAARADPDAVLIAPGFSCRSQLHGLADIRAKHPIEVLAEQLIR